MAKRNYYNFDTQKLIQESPKQVKTTMERDGMDTEMKELSPIEKSRTYHFASGKLTIENVKRIGIRPSGTHRLETVSGKKWIIPNCWLGIELDVNDWTF